MIRYKPIFNTHVVFLLLFILSVIKPFDLPFSNRLIGIGICILVSGLFIYFCISQSHRSSLWKRYRWEIILFAGLLASCLLSSAFNYSSYGNLKTYIAYGGSQPALMALLGMSYLLFQAWKQKRFYGWVILMLIAINILAVVQMANSKATMPIIKRTVAADANRQVMIEYHNTEGMMLEPVATTRGKCSMPPLSADCLIINKHKFVQIQRTCTGMELRSRYLDMPLLNRSLGTALVDANWRPFTFPEKKICPIVLIGPPSTNDTSPGIVELTDVSCTSAKIRFREWIDAGKSHQLESVSFFVVEPGRYSGSNGSILETGRFIINPGQKDINVVFEERFEKPPTVFLTPQNDNSANLVHLRPNQVERDGFSAALLTPKNGHGAHRPVTVGYMAISIPQGVTARIAIADETFQFRLKKLQLKNAPAPVLSATSIFRWYTIYGVIAALCIIYALSVLLSGLKDKKQTGIFLLLAVSALAGGIASHSRNFILTLMVGFICIAVQRKPNLKGWLFLIISFAIGFHVIIWLQPGMGEVLGKTFPYLKKLHNPGNIRLSEFIPDLSTDHSLSNRFMIWNRGISLWLKTPWLGLGSGVFSLQSGLETIHNLHNIYLQILVDSGIIGFVFFILLLIRLIHCAYRDAMFPVLAAVLGAFIFENFFDKSIAFILLLAWMVSPPKHRIERDAHTSPRSPFSLKFSALLFFSAIALAYILGTACFDINGEHSLHQADIYTHILDLLDYNAFNPIDLLMSSWKQFFHIPIYESIIAGVSNLFNADPLVVSRFINALLWAVSAYVGLRVVQPSGRKLSGLIFVYLFSTAPLILHYYAAPLPDILAIMLSLAGLFYLEKQHTVSGNDYLPFIIGASLLATAALINTSISLIFIIFQSVYHFLADCVSPQARRRARTEVLFFIILLVILFFTALIAEKMRSLIASVPLGNNSPNLTWYSGTIALKCSSELWKTLWQRMALFGPGNFGAVYAAVVILSSSICRSRKHVALSLSAVLSYFAGWLIFSNLYMLHSYCQLPVAVMLQLSFAVSLSILISRLVAPLSEDGRALASNTVILILMGISVIQVIIGNRPGHQSEQSSLPGLTSPLKNNARLLYITNKNNSNPAMRELVSTETKAIPSKIFEDSCDHYLEVYPAILAEGVSACLGKNQPLADYFLADTHITFFYRQTGVFKDLISLNNGMPVLRSGFDIYLSGNKIFYYKENCTNEDVAPMIFLHVFPNSEKNLPPGTPYGFQNLDFHALDQGRFFGAACLTSATLPAYKIDTIETGQVQGNQMLWSARIPPLTDQQLKNRKAMKALYQKVNQKDRVATAVFDIYCSGRKLIYFKKNCTIEDTQAWIFVHLFPTDKSLLKQTPEAKDSGFINIDFDFRQTGFMFNGDGIAVCELPDIDIEAIRTGQFTGKGAIWSVVFKLPVH